MGPQLPLAIIWVLDHGDRPPRPANDWFTPVAFLATLGILAALWMFLEARKRVRRFEAMKKELEGVELEFAGRDDLQGEIELLVSSSPARSSNVPLTTTENSESISTLRHQIGLLARQVEQHRNEIVEVQKIDPVLEATLRFSLENLTKRVEKAERDALTRWDVALIMLQLLGGLGVIFGLVKYALR